MRTLCGLLASWAVLAAVGVLLLVSLGGAGTWLSPSGLAQRQPTYGVLTRNATPMLPYRSDTDDENNPAALSRDSAVAKLRLKAEDHDLRSTRAAKPRPRPAPRAFATSRDSVRGSGDARVTDRHSSNF